MIRLAKLLVTVGVAALMAGAPALSQSAVALPAREVVAIRDAYGLLIVDPATGETVIRLGTAITPLTGAVTGDGVVYAGIATADGNDTEVVAVRVESGEQKTIGRVPGNAIVTTVDPESNRLHLLEFPPLTADGLRPPPAAVVSLPIPDGWGTTASLSQRDEGYGILSPDGRRWVGRVVTSTDQGTLSGVELTVVTFGEAGTTTAVLPVPPLNYHSMLLAPDGRTLYVIDYMAQAIQVVDVDQGAVVRVMGIGRERTKRPLCSAALSPDGNRLYVLGNTGPTNAGDGILVYETNPWRLAGHVLQDESRLYCLAAAPTGGLLYATTFQSDATTKPRLIALDPLTGRDVRTVSLATDDCCSSWLMAAA